MSRRLGAWRLVPLLVVSALLLPSVAASQPVPPRRHSFDSAASAQPTDTEPVRGDRAAAGDATWAARVKADAVATSSAVCDGCRGDARTVQVLYAAAAKRLRADNVATTWANCRSCAGTVVSVQVVLIRRPAALRLNNRALAVNGGCEKCQASAAAYQLVLRIRARPDLELLRRKLAQWADGLTSGAGDRTAELERLVTRLLGGAVVAGSARLTTS